MKKRLMALFLTFAMLMTFVLTAVLADEADYAQPAAEEVPVYAEDDSDIETISNSEYTDSITDSEYIDSITDSEYGDETDADSGNCSDSVTWALDSNGTLTISGTGEIPDYDYDNYAPWFDVRSSITAVIIEPGVTGIGNYAFYDCKYMMSVDIPDSVIKIGVRSFRYCTSLTSVVIPGGVTSWGFYTFSNCTSLKTVEFKDGIEEITNRIFDDCTNLTSITLPASVGYIGASYIDDSSLTDVYYDGGEADRTNILFYGNTTLFTNAVWHYALPTGSCGENMYWELSDDTLIIGGTGAMTDYTSADEVPWAAYKSSITRVSVRTGVTAISENAFAGCDHLTEVALPASITNIGASAFGSCSYLTTVNYAEDEEARAVIAIGDDNTALTDAVWGYSYRNIIASGTCSDEVTWTLDDFDNLTISGIGAIPDNCHPWHSKRGRIQSVNIESGITSVGSNAFSELVKLVDVSLSDSITSIGNYAFWNCVDLKNITMPDGVTSLGDYAFYNCGSLTSVTIPSGVITIGGSAFYWCTSLTSITIPVSVTSIGSDAFSSCSSLADVYYAGTEEQWNAITMEDGNDYLKNAAIHCTEDTRLYIVTQPDGGTATYGQTVTISFEAANAKSYQWYYSKDGENWTKLYWDGAKTDTLSVAYKASRSAFQYKCLVKGTDGTTLYTDPTSITLGTAPVVVINQQPQTVCGDISETVSLTIDAENAISYQWFYSKDDGTTWNKLYWDGATTDTLTFEVKKSRYSYVFYCKMTDGNGNAYYSTRCYLRQHFQLKKQPQDVTAAIGDSVNLTVSAVGVQSYQWYYSKDGGANWTKLSWTGAKSDTLSVDVTKTRCSYIYHCVLVGYDGTEATTNTVKITAAG